jgi:hypothetical protein
LVLGAGSAGVARLIGAAGLRVGSEGVAISLDERIDTVPGRAPRLPPVMVHIDNEGVDG